jgi:hypothetical protein
MTSHTARSVVGTIVVSVGVACLAFGVSAQDEDTLLSVEIVSVIPGRMDDYVELQIQIVSPALQRAGVPWRAVWRTADFGNTYDLQLVRPLGGLAELDAGGPLARVMDPDRLKHLVDQLRRCTVSRRSYATQYREDLSVLADDVGDMFLARQTTIYVAPGRVGEWEGFLRRGVPTFREAGVVFGVYHRLLGPDPTSWLIVENLGSFTELTRPDIIGHTFGEQADVVPQELAGVVTSIGRAVLRYDTQLSYSGIPSREAETR